MTDRYHADINAISTWDRGESGIVGRATGPRREPPAVCYICGDDVPDRPFFGDVTCGEPSCRDAMLRRPR